jgi:hypothetical protein
MKTQKCGLGWRGYLTSKNFILAFIVILIVLRTIFAIEHANNFNLLVNKKTVVVVNNEVVIDRKLKSDTVNIYVSAISDSVQTDTATKILVSDTNNVKR